MIFSQLVKNIYNAFDQPLPGFEAHLELAPYRKKVELNIKKNNPKIASTLLLLYPNHNDIYFCLTERQTYKGTHSNQISFPGGKNEIDERLHLDVNEASAGSSCCGNIERQRSSDLV